MKIGLFIPCYVDQLYPEIAVATYKLLRKFDCEIEYPKEQTCCGQPLFNSGCHEECKPLAKKFIFLFEKYEYIVAPSGSCISMVKHNYKKLGFNTQEIENKCYELVEFLHDILKVDSLDSNFQSKIGLHNSCHAHRELKLASNSEHNIKPFSKIKALLNLVNGIEIIEPARVDECCGFGGTFALNEPDVSTAMGKDRISEHLENNVEYITGVDISCLMHMQGLIDREKLPIKTIHIAQVLLGEKT